jgi:hypothetical protein
MCTVFFLEYTMICYQRLVSTARVSAKLDLPDRGNLSKSVLPTGCPTRLSSTVAPTLTRATDRNTAEDRISPQQLALQPKGMRAEDTSFEADELSLLECAGTASGAVFLSEPSGA